MYINLQLKKKKNVFSFFVLGDQQRVRGHFYVIHCLVTDEHWFGIRKVPVGKLLGASEMSDRVCSSDARGTTRTIRHDRC